MKEFNKLSRAEMKNVLGGVSQPPSCPNGCSDTGTCPGSQDCKSTTCEKEDGTLVTITFCAAGGD